MNNTNFVVVRENNEFHVFEMTNGESWSGNGEVVGTFSTESEARREARRIMNGNN